MAVTQEQSAVEQDRATHASFKILTSSFLRRRTAFWRSLIEMSSLSFALGVLSHLLGAAVGSPWSEIAGLLVYPAIVLGAWRLAPGRGTLWWRAGRVMVWCLLYALLTGVASWLYLEIWPISKPWFGLPAETLNVPFGELLLSTMLLTFSLVLPARVLLLLWGAARRRLRWLLTFSYVLVGTITLVIVPVVFSLFVAISSLATAPIVRPIDTSTERLAQALEPSLRKGVIPGELSPLLAQLIDGGAQLPL
ncbi:MAG: hypothetical protein H7Z42_21175, partial [Roseiflexaceae bacterium]|nr:hypothetical protein [Roseiflexaceae bacterium]